VQSAALESLVSEVHLQIDPIRLEAAVRQAKPAEVVEKEALPRQAQP
jgi:hypothetical protein